MEELQSGKQSMNYYLMKTIYLADSANAPYGLKSKQEIVALSMKKTRFLIEMIN
jgi:glutamate racemase